MIINIFFHSALGIFFVLNRYFIENIYSLLISLTISYFSVENIINYIKKREVMLPKGDSYQYNEKDKSIKKSRLTILVISILIELMLLLSFFKIIDLWPIGIK